MDEQSRREMLSAIHTARAANVSRGAWLSSREPREVFETPSLRTTDQLLAQHHLGSYAAALLRTELFPRKIRSQFPEPVANPSRLLAIWRSVFGRPGKNRPGKNRP
jgi:hypothetical protein